MFIRHNSQFPSHTDTYRSPELDPPQTHPWISSQGGSVVKCTPLVGPVQESPDPEIRQDRWGITKNTLFHVYLSLFIISDASQRPPDDFLKIDFFENLIFDYMVPHSISWVPDFRDKPWLPRTFGNLVYLHQIVGGDSHQLYPTEYATFGGPPGRLFGTNQKTEIA